MTAEGCESSDMRLLRQKKPHLPELSFCLFCVRELRNVLQEGPPDIARPSDFVYILNTALFEGLNQ